MDTKRMTSNVHFLQFDGVTNSYIVSKSAYTNYVESSFCDDGVHQPIQQVSCTYYLFWCPVNEFCVPVRIMRANDVCRSYAALPKGQSV